MDEFYKWLQEWVESINRFNEHRRKEAKEEAVLDSRIFSYDAKTQKYLVNSIGLAKLLNAQVCFIGDNPGALEKENKVYFYYETNEELRDERRAGSKVKQTIDLLEIDEVVYFNKCLISTDHTYELKANQINDTMEFVTKFIEKISEVNKQIIFVFLGKNKKFNKLFKQIEMGIIAQSICNYHPCSSKFNKCELSDSIKNKLIEKAVLFFKEFDCKNIDKNTDNDTDGDDDASSSPVIIR